MSHPAIAQVFDAGATPQGRPYFAMEYVRGEAITAYCNRHRLTTRQRIDLVLEICEGVQHAHQKGIIHRDLKPSNILVTVRDDRPVPKIIDFGVAKATTQHLTERTLYTELGVLIGTPEYAATAETRGTDPSRLAGQLRGDLDWITMKALEKDRTRRYGSVSDLAADLRRHLDNLPVIASPPSTVYRVRKFVRRHRVGVGAVAALVVVLVAFAATMGVQAQRIAREHDNANQEAAAAKQVSDFLTGLFKVSDPSEGTGKQHHRS